MEFSLQRTDTKEQPLLIFVSFCFVLAVNVINKAANDPELPQFQNKSLQISVCQRLAGVLSSFAASSFIRNPDPPRCLMPS